jgi:hypothetical protein
MKLFSTVLKWQRAEKKWMDGDFMELEPELIEAEVRHSFKRIFFSMSRIFDAICSKFEIYISTKLSFDREIRDIQKIFVLTVFFGA